MKSYFWLPALCSVRTDSAISLNCFCSQNSSNMSSDDKIDPKDETLDVGDKRKREEEEEEAKKAVKVEGDLPAEGIELKVDDGTPKPEPAPVPASTEGTTVFNDQDVLSGRGGGTNVHPGNRNFRDLINLHRRAYLKARKNDKPAISRAIVRSIRENNGKFLKKDEKTGLWFEIGDDAAREKTSQALRQRAPEMRKLLFDTEREEARQAAEEHMRNQQRFMMGMPPEMMAQMQNMAQQYGNMINANPAMLAQMASGKSGATLQPNDPYAQMFAGAMLGGGGMPGIPGMPGAPAPAPADGEDNGKGSGNNESARV